MNDDRQNMRLDNPEPRLFLLLFASFALLKLVQTALQADFFALALASILLGCVIALGHSIQIGTPSANRLLVRGISALFFVYVCIGPWKLPELAHLGIGSEALILINVFALLFLAGSFRLEGLIVPGCWLVLAQKGLISVTTGLPISSTDYMPLIELGILLGLAPIVFGLSNKSNAINKTDKPRNWKHQFYWVLLLSVAIHSANYLFSAAQKIVISDPLWSWVTENPTYYLMAAAYENGSLPMTLFGMEVSNTVYQLLISYAVPLNLMTLLIQLVPFIALRKIKWMVASMVLFDITHIVIFLVTGIFFYKWIILNLLIVSALLLVRHYQISLSQYAFLLLATLLAPVLFFVAFLGWHDSPSYNDEYFIAHTTDGQQYRIPTNFFLSASVTYAQGRISRVKPGHFPTGPLGVVYKVKSSDPLWQAMNTCTLDQSQETKIGNKNRIEQMIKHHHKHFSSLVDENGFYDYDLFPHHIWSMPWSFKEFRRLDIRTIVGYSYIIESKCLASEANKLGQSESLKRSEHYFAL